VSVDSSRLLAAIAAQVPAGAPAGIEAKFSDWNVTGVSKTNWLEMAETAFAYIGTS
jgi:hypothetical protein